MLRSSCYSPHLPRVVAGALALAASSQCAASGLTVQVVDERGEPVQRVAVYAVPSTSSAADAASPSAAIMDQAHNAFVPHLLVVQTGTEVLFPNNDVVSHHVYSFSEAKTFELGLYKGDAYPPVRFDTPGVVVLGCNIHDGMLGYILVVATPYHGLTDERGTAELPEVPEGDYTVEVWTPRARAGSSPAGVRVTVGAAPTVPLQFMLGKLSPEHDHGKSSLSWERY